jgi:hypothetical protein
MVTRYELGEWLVILNATGGGVWVWAIVHKQQYSLAVTGIADSKAEAALAALDATGAEVIHLGG